MLHWCRSVLLLLLSTLACGALAQDVDLYEGEAPVATQDEAERAAALPAALAQVVVKLTGSAEAASDPRVRAELGRAATLMQRYRYRQDVETIDGLPQIKLTLVARFDPAAVTAMIRNAGRSLWPAPRPVPAVWLAIDDGRGPRLLGSAQANAVSALTQRGRARGVAFTYPLLDLDDQRQVPVAAIWSGDARGALVATARYQTPVALVGKLYRSTGGWTAEWQLFEGGELVDRIQARDPQAGVVLASGADLVAERLARRYSSEVLTAGPAGAYTIWIDGIRSAEDYARALGYVQKLPVVRGVSPRRSEGTRLQLQLDLSAGVEGFARLVTGGGVLSPLPAQTGADRMFRLEP